MRLHLGVAFCDLVLQAVLVDAEFLAQLWIGSAEDLDGEQGGVDRARAAERHGGDRDTGRHLERGVERIKTVERLIAGAVMIESNHHKTHVVLGARVTVRDIEFDETDTYVIVGSAEANPAEGRISNESPMGRALMGGRVGQHKQINTPGGTINVDIVEIE